MNKYLQCMAEYTINPKLEDSIFFEYTIFIKIQKFLLVPTGTSREDSIYRTSHALIKYLIFITHQSIINNEKI
jgi:hypothetical protein